MLQLFDRQRDLRRARLKEIVLDLRVQVRIDDCSVLAENWRTGQRDDSAIDELRRCECAVMPRIDWRQRRVRFGNSGAVDCTNNTGSPFMAVDPLDLCASHHRQNGTEIPDSVSQLLPILCRGSWHEPLGQNSTGLVRDYLAMKVVAFLNRNYRAANPFAADSERKPYPAH